MIVQNRVWSEGEGSIQFISFIYINREKEDMHVFDGCSNETKVCLTRIFENKAKE